MNALLIYMFKAALYLSAFYLIYYFLLSRDTTYSRNRAFILFSLASALILPNITLQNTGYFDTRLFGRYLSEVFVTAASGTTQKLNNTSSFFTPLNIIYLVYLTGAVIFGLKLLTDIANLLFLILRQRNSGSRIIRFHGFNTAGFSAMGYVFINTKLKPEEAAEIIKHEENHLKRNHFLDILFVGIIKSLQWFNPAVYLFNRSLRAIHEFQADQECLESGIPIVNYQGLLLNQVFKTNSFTLTNSFSNPSLIKKRMIMMTKKRTSSFASIKLLLVVPVLGFVLMFVSAFTNTPAPSSPPASPAIAEDTGETPFVQVEEMPIFPGGDEALLKYIAQNTNYPANARENSIQGRVIVRFCVTEKGSINKISVIQGVDPELDAEAIRVAGSLPTFKPGRQGGRNVPVWYMIPITFSLK
ncbi:MAG: TonB family protein [Bacteroidales bacterium]|nr:TonB family protein [Bacteroidales bacterium]